jgi:hypothetical protein
MGIPWSRIKRICVLKNEIWQFSPTKEELDHVEKADEYVETHPPAD